MARTHRFPHGVFFVADEKEAIVLAVLNLDTTTGRGPQWVLALSGLRSLTPER